jgi:hypothetical protein
MIAQAGLVVTNNYLSVIMQGNARVVELVDTLALGASAFGREGSSPFARTISKSRSAGLLFDMV